MIYYIFCQNERLFPIGFFIAKRLAIYEIDQQKQTKPIRFTISKIPKNANLQLYDKVCIHANERPTFIPYTLSAVIDESLFYAACYFYHTLLKEGYRSHKPTLLPN